MSASALAPTSGIEPDPARQVSGPPGVEECPTRIALAPSVTGAPFTGRGLSILGGLPSFPENDRWGAAVARWRPIHRLPVGADDHIGPPSSRRGR